MIRKTLYATASIVLPLIVCLLLFLVVSFTNQLAGMSTQVRDIETKIEALKEENELYSHSIASVSSLFILETKAKELGFVEPAKSSYMVLGSDTFPVALRPAR